LAGAARQSTGAFASELLTTKKGEKMTNEQIFELIGMNADQIRAVTTAQPIEPVAILKDETTRPICKVCGHVIGKYTCKQDWRKSKTERTKQWKNQESTN
jgi:hypothetical protein